jgi:hypothetical protein
MRMMELRNVRIIRRRRRGIIRMVKMGRRIVRRVMFLLE